MRVSGLDTPEMCRTPGSRYGTSNQCECQTSIALGNCRTSGSGYCVYRLRWQQGLSFHGCSGEKVSVDSTPHTSFTLAQRTCFMMCDTPHWLKCLHERVISSAWSSTLCGCPSFDSLFLTLFLSVCFSYPCLFHLNPELNLFLPCGRHQDN